jgi:hypothetical protein
MDQYGCEKKPKKTKKTTKPKTKKPAAKKTTKTRSKAKGGNFLGAVGDLVAPTGWGPFATAAGLLAVDRVSAALRRGTKEKKEKMKGGDGCRQKPNDAIDTTLIGKEWESPTNPQLISRKVGLSNWIEPPYSEIVINNKNRVTYSEMKNRYNKWINDTSQSMITIKCFDEKYYYFEVTIKCNGKILTYRHLPEGYNKTRKSNTYQGYLFDNFKKAKEVSESKDGQFALINSALNHYPEFCKS